MPRYGRKERDFTGASMTGHDTAGAAGLWISDVLRPVGHGLENDRFREGRRRDREKEKLHRRHGYCAQESHRPQITKTNHYQILHKNIYLNIR